MHGTVASSGCNACQASATKKGKDENEVRLFTCTG